MAFPVSFGQLGANSTAAEFTGNLDGFVGGNMELSSDDSFTVEVFASVDNFVNSGLFHLVSQASPAVIPTGTYWSFQVRNDRGNGTVDRELNVNFGGATSWDGTPSGIIIDEATDYFLSAAFDAEAHELTYYAQDLSDRSLRISSVPYVADQLQDSDEILIGDVPACNCLTDGLIDEVRISEGVLDYPETLVAQAEFRQSDYENLDSITLGPRDAYRVSEDVIRDRRRATTDIVNSTQRNLLKFELPDFVSSPELETATLRLFVRSASGENAELDLWHSRSDNDFERELSDFADPSYVETDRSIFTAGSEVGDYVDVDVTDLVLADLNQDGDALVSAFRLNASDGSRFSVSMPRLVDQQPLLMFSLRSESASGDFNQDGVLDAEDIDLLTAAMATNDPSFDVNSDGAVDQLDHTAWVKDLKRTWFGDANLDGEFSSLDLVDVFGAGKFETDAAAGWSEGDWNGDGGFSSGDLVAAFSDGGYELGPRAVVATVPEPSTTVQLVVLTGILSLGLRHRLGKVLASPESKSKFGT